MKFSYVIGSYFIMAFFSACQQAEIESENRDDLRMSIVASVNNRSEVPKSRLQGDDPGSVAFKESDAIGVFVDGGAVTEWTYSSSTWQSDGDVLWPDKDSPHTFNAFYPYVESATYGSVPLPNLTGQTGDFSDVLERDFLVASTRQSYGDDGVVYFDEDHPFEHVLTLLQFTIKGDGELQDAVLNRVRIAGAGITSTCTYSFEDGEISYENSSEAELLESATAISVNGQDQTFYFIVNPIEDATGVELCVDYTIEGETYEASTYFATDGFVGGSKQNYTVAVKGHALVISGSSIQDWGDGESMENIVINGETKDETA